MIRLENVNKYFNKHKKNEIHVINNTSLSFPHNGLVAILGPSGCGKTTLLNTIGGLDNIDNGSIYINNELITKRYACKIDEIRNLNIGYIFQDYKLIDHLSVYENVAISLRLVGYKDQNKINELVMYALEKVKMARYKNRPASMLSGGEKQRVGIARAIVKNPKIIIADEPTGNLDSKNSLEIMNIIRSIADKYLVILVTHEEELARFYATRIIELQDGKVLKDYENNTNNNLNYEIDSRVYLKDYKDIQKIKQDNLNINVYRNKGEKLDLNIVFKNGSIYIESKDNTKLEVIDSNSNIELLDEHYKEIKSVHDMALDFDIGKLDDNKERKYSSIIRLSNFVKYGFKKVFSYPFLKKILLGGFFLSGMFVFYAISSIMAAITINDKDFISINKNYLTVKIKNIATDKYYTYEENNNINYILPTDSIITFKVNYDKYLQTQQSYGKFNASLSDSNMISEKDLVIGKMPQNDYEIVVDKMVLEAFIKDNATKEVGFANVESLLNHEVYLKNMAPFTIVGMTSKDEPNVYAKQNMFLNMIANSEDMSETYQDEYMLNSTRLVDYNLAKDNNIILVKGSMPNKDNETIINIDLENTYSIGDTITFENLKLKVVGFYKVNSEEMFTNYLVNSNTIKNNLISKASVLSIYSKDKEDTIELFKKDKLNISDSYEYAKSNYLKEKRDSIISMLSVAGVILGISLIEIFLMIRSSFLSRIKEVGIYRAIGIKKADIYKMFSGEVIAIFLLASVPGITLMTYILHCFRNVPYICDMYLVNISVYLFSLIVVLIFNLLVGLIPVYNTIRKTPAQILARYDVD